MFWHAWKSHSLYVLLIIYDLAIDIVAVVAAELCKSVTIHLLLFDNSTAIIVPLP